MTALLVVVIALLTAVVVSQHRLNRRVLEFLRSEDVAQREVIGKLIVVLQQQARKRGHVEVKLNSLQKEVQILGELVNALSTKLADGSGAPGGVLGPLAKHPKVEFISGAASEHPDGAESGTG